MKRVLIAGLAGGFAVFVWTAISWMGIGWHNVDMRNIPNGDQVIAELSQHLDEEAIYHYPGMPGSDEGMSEEAYIEKFKKGPVINMLVYSPAGFDPMSPMAFLSGLFFNILSALLAAYLLSMAVGKLPGYGQRVLFVAVLGVFAAIVGPIMEWNWWHFPTGFSMVNAADSIVTWTIAGLVLGKLIQPETES